MEIGERDPERAENEEMSSSNEILFWDHIRATLIVFILNENRCGYEFWTLCFYYFWNVFWGGGFPPAVTVSHSACIRAALSSKRLSLNIGSNRSFEDDYFLIQIEGCARKTLTSSLLPGRSGGDCLKQCPQQTFSDSSGWLCQSCHTSCQTCHGPRATNCDLCLGGNPPVHGQCPPVNCPLGQYYDSKRNNQLLMGLKQIDQVTGEPEIEPNGMMLD